MSDYLSLLDQAKNGDKRALSKLISAVESGGAAARGVEAALGAGGERSSDGTPSGAGICAGGDAPSGASGERLSDGTPYGAGISASGDAPSGAGISASGVAPSGAGISASGVAPSEAYSGARVIGITGPPGSGKSTLTNMLIEQYRKLGRRVGVIAVDPTSPFTGGAILGDRIRMAGNPDTGLFIRSMGSRGATGGLSAATRGAVNVLSACGFDEIIVESVGSGQNDVEIISHADMILLLAVPGLGDDIQSIKAGLLEIGDIFVVNKCDLPGADMVSLELQSSLEIQNSLEIQSSLARPFTKPLVVMVSAITGEGIPELTDIIDSRWETLKKSGELALRRISRVQGSRPARDSLSDYNSITKGTGMNCLNIDHIGVAVKDLEQAAAFYENVLGIKRAGVEEVAGQQVKVMFLPCGDCEVELLESTAEGSPVDRFLNKNGEGVQHIAIRVEDIDAALADLKEKGVRLIDEKPRYGAGGARIAFIHPKETNGVLLELCERTGL